MDPTTTNTDSDVNLETLLAKPLSGDEFLKFIAFQNEEITVEEVPAAYCPNSI